MKFLGVLTRCKDEFFVKEFCDYYISQGADKIYIIDDDSLDKSIYDGLNAEKVTVFYEKNVFNPNNGTGQMKIANQYYNNIRNEFTWLIFIDVDEFITTKKNINRTLKQELLTTFKKVDCIKVPWVMMSSNNREKNPKSILIENTYRWNHDKTHPHKMRKFRCRYNSIECKCIFKTQKFKTITTHNPSDVIGNAIIVNSINITTVGLASHYRNLREKDISNGYLLCYHYRIISRENNLRKLEKKSIYKKFTLEDLIKSDHAEINDDTLKNKVMAGSN